MIDRTLEVLTGYLERDGISAAAVFSLEEMNAIAALGLRKNKVTGGHMGGTPHDCSARPLDPVGPYIGAST
jgi:hypothetical protein